LEEDEGSFNGYEKSKPMTYGEKIEREGRKVRKKPLKSRTLSLEIEGRIVKGSPKEEKRSRRTLKKKAQGSGRKL